MRGRRQSALNALTIFAVFAGSIIGGKMIFDRKIEPGKITQTGIVEPTPELNSEVATTPELSLKQKFVKDITKKYPQHKISRELNVSNGGVESSNFKMETFIAKDHILGATFTHRFHRKGTVKSIPAGIALQNGFEEVSSYSMNLDATGKKITVDGEDVYEFTNTYADIDERMKMRKDGGLEHDIIVNKKLPGMDQAQHLVTKERLELSPGLSVWQGTKKITGKFRTSNAFQIRDASTNLIFEVRRPYAFDNNITDANGAIDDASQLSFPGSLTGCEYFLDVADNHVDLAVATPTKWLNDPARAYPVTIDPNLGPGGLSDALTNGGRPIYIGTTGSGTFLGIHDGAVNPGADPNGPPTQQPALLSIPCPYINGQVIKLNAFGNGCYVVPMPFNFIYYNILRAQCITPLFISINGVASFQGCASPGNTFIPSPADVNDAMFAYHDSLQFSSDPKSGIYVMVEGPVGRRRFIIEWFAMGFTGGSGSERISFNLILYECNNLIEIIIGSQGSPDILDPNIANPTGGTNATTGDTDRGEASVGIEDPTGTIGIQFEFNSASAGVPTQAGETTGLAAITPETSVIFTPVASSQITVTVDGNTVVPGQTINPGACLPVRSCFNAVVIPPDTGCGVNTASFPPSFGFQWTMSVPDSINGGDTIIGLFKTQKFCKTFVTPGAIKVQLQIIDATNTLSSFGTFTYLVCDIPRIQLGARPQGGTYPLQVGFNTISSASFTDTITAQPPDDCNTVPVGTAGLAPGFVVVEPGPIGGGGDGLLHTKVEGDDVLDTINQQILAGPNGINETTALNGSGVVVAGGVDRDGDGLADFINTAPSGDDCYSGINIVASTDGQSQSTAIAPDRQVVPVGQIAGAPGVPIWKIEKLSEEDLQTPPAFISNMPSGSLSPSFIFTREGIYKVTVIWTGIDVATNLPTSAEYSIFIFVEDPARPNDDNLYIDGSDFTVVWKGKEDNPDDDDLEPDNPNRDSIIIRGMINVPNIVPSALGSTPIRARVVINGTLSLFDFGDGVLDPVGKTTVRDAFTGTQRTFALNLPGGRFSIKARKIRLDQALGLVNLTENRLLPMHLRIELYDFSDPNNPVALYPQEPETRGAMITYDYRSVINGRAKARYRFGDFTADGLFVVGKPGAPGGTTTAPIPPEINTINTGGQTALISGVFVVRQANFKLKGGNVTADIRGKLARFGGDSLRPQANSDVVVEIGPAVDSLGNTIASGFKETLNFSTSPTWKTVGKKKREIFVFSKNKSLGQTGIRQLSWHNKAGDFRVRTYPLPNRDEGPLGGVGLNVLNITQAVPFRLFISHDNDTSTSLQNFDGRTLFLVTKSGKSGFRRK